MFEIVRGIRGIGGIPQFEIIHGSSVRPAAFSVILFCCKRLRNSSQRKSLIPQK